jgi:tetratricopeptide (TPR) repeat protein
MKQMFPIPAMRAMRRLVVLTAAGTLLLSIAGCGGGEPEQAASPTAATPIGAASQTRAQSDARIAFLEARAADDPLDVFSLNELAIEHLQRARETGDVSSLSRAREALRQSLERRPEDNYEALALSANLAVTQHDFAAGLVLARRATALKPKAAYAYGAAGDAQMGLGRYDEAAQSYATLHGIEPSLSSESRLALFAQLRGMHEEALAHWDAALAMAQGDGVPEHEAWARTQTAHLRFMTGDLDESRSQYAQALGTLPGYVHALAGLGRVAAARGDLDAAIAHYETAIAVVPLPEYVIALGDVYAAAGDPKRAGDQYELVAAIEQLYAANGVNLDLQIALFNADHGRDLQATVARAEALFAAQPNIQAADALAWARYNAGDIDGARTAIGDALRTGSRDPMLLFHAGMIHKAAGDTDLAATFLRQLNEQNRRFSVLYAEAARQAFEEVSPKASR